MKSVTDCRKWLCSLACFFTAFLIAVSANTCKQEADASRIAPYMCCVFIFLAESNSKTDQQLKLKVREQVLSYIQENAPAYAGKEELASAPFPAGKILFSMPNRHWPIMDVKQR